MLPRLYIYIYMMPQRPVVGRVCACAARKAKRPRWLAAVARSIGGPCSGLHVKDIFPGSYSLGLGGSSACGSAVMYTSTYDNINIRVNSISYFLE